MHHSQGDHVLNSTVTVTAPLFSDHLYLHQTTTISSIHSSCTTYNSDDDDQYRYNPLDQSSLCLLGSENYWEMDDTDHVNPQDWKSSFLGSLIVGPTKVLNKGKGRALIRKGFVYLKSNNQSQEWTYWRCDRGDCMGSVKESKINSTLDSIKAHNHGIAYVDCFSRIFRDQLMTAVQDSHIPIARIYKNTRTHFMKLLNELPLLEEEKGLILGEFKSFRSSMERFRKIDMPNIPKTKAEIICCFSDPKYSEYEDVVHSTTTDRRLKRLILFNGFTEQEKHVIIFANNHFLNLLVDNAGGSSKVFMDGTFSICPAGYEQLFTIHAYYREHLFPVVFALMEDRTADSYEFVFRKIMSEVINQTNQGWTPQEIQIDFEKASMKAIRKCFPNTRIKGCQFHHAQAVIRKVSKLGLTVPFSQLASKVRTIVRFCCGLVFLPQSEVESAFNEIESIVPEDASYAAMLPAIKQFMRYFKSTWIGDTLQEKQPTYPIAMWNHNGVDCDRTNNKVEGWHSTINGREFSHPNILKFHGLICEIQKDSDVKLALLRSNYTQPLQTRKRYATLNRKLMRLQTDYANDYSARPLEFLRKVSVLIDPKLVDVYQLDAVVTEMETQ